MYILPNNKKIDHEEIMEAMKDNNFEHHWFFDSKTGKVEFLLDDIDEETNQLIEKFDKDNRYFAVQKIPSHEQYKWMEDFVYEFVPHEDKNLAEKLAIAIDGKGAFGRFYNVLHGVDKSWLEAWREWERHCLYEEMENWFDKLSINIKEDMELFDDCPICQAMKNGENTVEGLKKAFREAKKKGGVVNDNIA